MTVNFNYDNKTIFSGIKLPSEEEKPKTIFSGIKLPEEDYAVKPILTWDNVKGFIDRAGGSFIGNSTLMGMAEDTKQKQIDIYIKFFKEKYPEQWAKLEEEAKQLEQEEVKDPTSGFAPADTVADIAGSIGGTIFDYATISKLIGPLMGKVPAPVKPGITMGATRIAKEGLEDITGEDKTAKDYAKAGLSGFAG